MTTAARPFTDMPVLEPGDHLDGADFDRRYALRTDIGKAELVGGVVFMPTPARAPEHGTPVSLMSFWLGSYAIRRVGLNTASNASLRLGPNDHVQPDAMMWNELSGRARLGDDHHMEGAPELIVEIAASSAAYDLYEKKGACMLAGVQEYIVWRTVDRAIDWFELQNGLYVRMQPGAGGFIDSRVFPGLRLQPTLLVNQDPLLLPAALGLN